MIGNRSVSKSDRLGTTGPQYQTRMIGLATRVLTPGSMYPYAPILFDYIRRAMPLDAPKSLTNDQAYALAAFILERSGIIDASTAMTAETLPAVEMPNRDNFIDVWVTQGEKPW